MRRECKRQTMCSSEALPRTLPGKRRIAEAVPSSGAAGDRGRNGCRSPAVVHDTTAALPATDPKPASSAFLDRLAPAASPLRSRGLCELLFPSFLVGVEVHFASTDGRSVVFTSSRIPCPPGRLAYKRSWRSHPASDRRDESHIPDRRSPCTLSR